MVLNSECGEKLVHVSNCAVSILLHVWFVSVQYGLVWLYHFPCYHLVREENRKEIDRIVSNFTGCVCVIVVEIGSRTVLFETLTASQPVALRKCRVATATTSNKLKFGVKFCPILRKCHVVHDNNAYEIDFLW